MSIRLGANSNPKAGKMEFNDSFLEMTYAGRFISHVVISIWTTIHIITTAILLLSDIEVLFWVGVVNALYFVNRAIHYSQADYEISPQTREVKNISRFITPRAKKLIITSFNKSVISGGRFSLNFMMESLENRSIRKIIADLNVSPEEFIGKLESHISKDIGEKQERGTVMRDVEKLVTLAFDSLESDKKFVDYMDLFVALHKLEDSPTVLFELFDIVSDELELAVKKNTRTI